MINLGEFYTLKVKRLSDLGYMLTDGHDEVLLHYGQSLKEHNVNDEVKVFIYSDKAKRLTATEETPFASLTYPGFGQVKDIISGVGIFIDINTPKDVLISKDYLPYNEQLWPEVGSKLFIKLKIKKDTLTAKPLNKYEIMDLHKNVIYEELEEVEGFVSIIVEKGIGILTSDLMYVFVPNTQLRGEHKLGEKVTVKITKALDNEYYGTLNKQKEEMIDSDKEIIIDYMKLHHGVMKLTAKSSAEEVEKALKISRKAFKRAYGGLYKDHIIDFDDDKTFFVK
ncbi:MAG: hypothetical protein K5892_04230 [Acholeplasmatales bacterium]|nr:hypothetical protein [Acholeplasmatales bacterium]